LRIVSITHVQELIEQNYKELLNIAPFAPAGMYSAGLGARDIKAQILFGGIQSLHRRVKELGWVDLLIVDEAHLIPRKAETMYGRFISQLMLVNPDMRVVGFTATPYRTDSGRLDDGEERLFDKVVYEYDIGDGIATATYPDSYRREPLPGSILKALEGGAVTYPRRIASRVR
jgi:DNA repair protein RadD